MSGIKIRFNTPEPSKKTINKYKNFNSLMDNYKKYYSSRGIRYMFVHEKRKLVFIVIILILLLLLFLGEI